MSASSGSSEIAKNAYLSSSSSGMKVNYDIASGMKLNGNSAPPLYHQSGNAYLDGLSMKNIE